MTRERKSLLVQFGLLSLLMVIARPAPLNALGVWILSGILFVGLLAFAYGFFLSVPYRRVREGLPPTQRRLVNVLNAVVGVSLLGALVMLLMTGSHLRGRALTAVAWIALFASLMISNGIAPSGPRD